MKTLEDIKKQFEDKTRGGQKVNILAYHPDQSWPIHAEVLKDDKWVLISFTKDGYCHADAAPSIYDLIKKRPVLPKDVLCEVWNTNAPEDKYKRFSDGAGTFYQHGANSLTSAGVELNDDWNNFRVIGNEPKPWFGGECPIPDGCKFKVRFNGRWHNQVRPAKGYSWGEADHITAYQILGEADK